MWDHWYPYFELLVTSSLHLNVGVDSFTCLLCRMTFTMKQNIIVECKHTELEF